MKKLISIISIIVLSISMLAQDSTQVSKPKSKLAYNGYIGGMMLHLGYVYHTELPELGGHTVSALTKGIGGTIKIKFGNHLRVGTEGYVSTANIFSKHTLFISKPIPEKNNSNKISFTVTKEFDDLDYKTPIHKYLVLKKNEKSSINLYSKEKRKYLFTFYNSAIITLFYLFRF